MNNVENSGGLSSGKLQSGPQRKRKGSFKPGKRKTNILVIEDDAIIRTSICEALLTVGYELAEASDGEQALGLLENRSFDLVVSDFVVPKKHGLTLIYLIHSRWPHVPLLVLSGNLSQSSGNLIFRGDADFLEKPVDPEVLLATVARLLSAPK